MTDNRTQGLLLVAHGSRRNTSNDEVRMLTTRIGQSKHGYQRVDCAFLELAEPSIPDGIRCMAGSGIDDIVIMPYFLSAGRHVAEDIPGEVDSVRAEFPDVEIRIAPYLGSSPVMASVLLEQATKV